MTTTGYEWDYAGDGSVLIDFTLTWKFQKGEAETRPISGGGDPGWPDSMELLSITLDGMDSDGESLSPGANVRKEWCERFEAELDRDDELRERLEEAALEAYWERQPCREDY